MSLHPYLNFGGNSREAFTRNRGILGGGLGDHGHGEFSARQ